MIRIGLAVALCLLIAAEARGQNEVILTAVLDNTLFENSNGQLSNGLGTCLYVGRTQQGSDYLRRGLLKFDLEGALPVDAVITSAVLNLQVAGGASSNLYAMGLHAVLQAWGEGTSVSQGGGGGGGASATPGDATWLHTFFPDQLWNNVGGDFEPMPDSSALVTVAGMQLWPSTPETIARVESWRLDPSLNHGWLLLGNEVLPGTARKFYSKDATLDFLRPRLIIQFSMPVQFVRGDTNGDGAVGLGDAIASLQVLFAGAGPASCQTALDVNDDGILGLMDPLALLNYLFAQGPPPPAPFPDCGQDGAPDLLGCETPSCP